MIDKIICKDFGTTREVRDPKMCIRDNCPWYSICTEGKLKEKK